ncbi:DUF11 domain-containing protein [Streptomyces sp. CBMA29]|uniref:DUF11 domain-containing protein n=1 Tax=Streptomyces sp. CBMA29 TaxID=1896314 RepID=UPI0016619078|nr:DUF11 domain-containing protein [Streptomyces sp. CBMA29]MBD0735266.1 hypothetical protein [Streptomyces sp. CBMA29]
MEIVSHRWRFAALAAALPLLLAGAVSAAAPAVAADPPAISATASVTLPPKVAAGPDGVTKVAIGFGKDRPGHPTGPRTITVDFGDLTGVADVTFLNPPCAQKSERPNIAVCTVPHDKADGSDTVRFNLFAQGGLQGGPAHVITYTGTWGGVAATPASTEVKVGTSSDVLAQGQNPTGVKPGDTFSVPLTAHNRGLDAADGFRLDLVASPGLKLVKDPACTYATTREGEDHATCTYTEKLAAGASATALPPLRVHALDTASNERITIETTSLVSPGPGRAPVPDHFSVSSSIAVHVATTADFQVTGAHVSGPVGANVKARVTLTNNGPATVSGWIFAVVYVEVPKGTHPVYFPHDCEGIDAHGTRYPEDRDAVRFECWIHDDTSAPGTSTALDFTFHVDQRVVRPGKVSYKLNVASPPADPVPSNDTAAITVTVTGGPSGSASPTSSPRAGTGAGTGGGTGSPSPTSAPTASGTAPATGNLASTGSAPVALITAASAAALTLGAAAFLTFRRRRPHP